MTPQALPAQWREEAEGPIPTDQAIGLLRCADALESALREQGWQPITTELREALEAIVAEPFGCPFCDSGRLRNPAKGHTARCGFALAEQALALPPPPGGTT